MKALAVALTVCVLAALPAHAQAAIKAHVPVDPDVAVVYQPCPTASAYHQQSAGCTYPDAPVVYVTNPADTHTLFHELGHQFAFRLLGDTGEALAGGMRKFAKLTRLRGGGARAFADVREQFADAYAMCALGHDPQPGEWGDTSGYFPTGYEYNPTPRIHDNVCAMIVRAGARLA